MSKRKEYPGKQDAPAVPRKKSPQPIGFQWLPDSLIEKVISYNRPKEDETEPFCRWLCQMSATCPAFRRVVLSSTNGSIPLTPTLFHLNYSREDGDYCNRLLKLVDTIKMSDWMGTHIQCVRAQVTTQPTADALVRLLCGSSPCFPKLSDVYIKDISVLERCFRNVDSHLFEMAKIHPLLSSLILPKDFFVFGTSTSPETFASIATCLPNLKRFGIYGDNTTETSEHLDAFLRKTGAKLTALSLSHLSAQGTCSIASHCHNLDTLILQDRDISVRNMTKILRSNPNLAHIDVQWSRALGEGLFDTIIENTPKLTTFRAQWCPWVDDDGLMRLFDHQIKVGGGKISLTTLGIYHEVMVLSGSTGTVTTAGIRKVLNKWRETGPLLPFSLEVLTDICVADAYLQPLIAEFPDVTFKKLWLRQSFD